MMRLSWFRKPVPRALPSGARNWTLSLLVGGCVLLSLSCCLFSPLWQLLELDIGVHGIRCVAVVASYHESFAKRYKSANFESAEYAVEVVYLHEDQTYHESFPNKGYRLGDSIAVDISPLLPGYAVLAETRNDRSFAWDGVLFGAIFAFFFGFLAVLVYLRYVRRPRQLLRAGVLAPARTVARGRRAYRTVWECGGTSTEAEIPYLGLKGEAALAQVGARYQVAYLPGDPGTVLPAQVLLRAVTVRPPAWLGLVLLVFAGLIAALLRYDAQAPVGWSGGVAERGRAALCDMRRIAQALEGYEAEQGSLPERLTTLVPDFLPQLPRDPFGNEFGYERHQQTWDPQRPWVASLRCRGQDGQDGPGQPPRQANDDILYPVRFPLYGMPLGQ